MKINTLLQKSKSIFLSNAIVVSVKIITAPMLIYVYGIEKYGYFVTMFVIASMINTIFNMQPWQSLIQYWFRPEFTDRRGDLIFKTINIDLYSAVIASIIYYFSYDYIFSRVGIPVDMINSVGFYFFLFILFKQISMPIGLFRCLSMFKEQSFFEYFEALIKLLVTISAGIYRLDLSCYIILIIMLNIVINTIRFVYSCRVIFVQRIHTLSFGGRVDGFLKYSFWVNMKAIIDLPITHIDRLIVISFLGPSSAGIFDLMKKSGGIFSFIVKPLSQVLLPELTRLAKENKIKDALNISLLNSKKMALNFVFIGSGVWAILKFSCLLEVAGASEFRVHLNEMMLYLVAQSIGTSFVFIHVLFMAIGKIKQDVYVLFFVNLMYLFLLFLTIETIELWAVGTAFFIQSITILSFKVFYIKNLIAKKI